MPTTTMVEDLLAQHGSQHDLPDFDEARHRVPVSSLPVDLDSLSCPLSPNRRAALLVVVRESDAHDWLQMEGMAAQTYAGLMGNPIADAIGRAGITPMHGREFDLTVEFGGAVGSVVVTVVPEIRRHGSTKAVLFRVGRTFHLWSMASAASVGNENKVNAWNQIVMDVIREFRPVHLHAATVSRLIRSQRQAWLLQSAMLDNVDFMTFSGMRLEFTGPQAMFGQMMLNMLGMMAAQERDWIMQRLLTGRIALFRRGQWLYGRSYVPFGYAYDRASRSLVIDPDAARIVPAMIDVLLSDSNKRMKLIELSRLGLTTRAAQKGFEEPRLLDEGTASATSALGHLLSSASVWVYGQYVIRLSNPGLRHDHIAGIPIVRGDDREDGELQMVANLPVPDGGWAAPDKLAALWTMVLAREVRRASRGQGRRPLSGELAEAYPHLDIATLASEVAQEPAADGAVRGPRTGGRAKQAMSALSGRRWTKGRRAMEIVAVRGGNYEIRTRTEIGRPGLTA